MKLFKFHTHPLEKSYCVAPLRYRGQDCLLVAAEKQNKCLLFDLDGNLLDTVWEQPGGTMSMVQIPGSDGVFLATHRFYSPNDSQHASIVCACPGEQGWRIHTIAQLPFVHRFDLLCRQGKRYLIACTIKSAHAYKDDWTSPGKIYVAELPDGFPFGDERDTPRWTVLRDGLTKNHGYCRCADAAGDYALVGSESGVLKVVPPDSSHSDWRCLSLLDRPTSDMALADLDEDGEEELITISPFHGDAVDIYHLQGGRYEPVYHCDRALPFAHALWAGKIHGKPVALIGHRSGSRDLVAFFWDGCRYVAQVLEQDAGAANLLHYCKGEEDRLLCANREHNEIGFYRIEV